MSIVIEKVETFIQRLNDLDYIISPEAGNAIYVSPSNSTILKKSLADYLANAIYEYELNRDSKNFEVKALVCHLWISRVFAQGLIQEGKGLAGKLKECREKNVRLEGDLERLAEEYLDLKELTRRVGLTSESDLERQR